MKRQAEVLALLDELTEEAVSGDADLAAEAISLLMYISHQACRRVESLALSSNRKHAEIVERIASQVRHVAFSADLHLPSALKKKSEKSVRQESRGDQLRRKLTAAFQDKAELWTVEKTVFDALNLAIMAFNAAVRCDPLGEDGSAEFAKLTKPLEVKFKPSPHIAIQSDEKKALSQTLPFPMEQRGVQILVEGIERHRVSTEMRAELLLPRNKLNETTWAEKFVEWYRALHPWPFMRNGEIILEYERGKTLPQYSEGANKHLLDPLHLAAWRRLCSCPGEKDPWNSLKAVARERFEALFKGKGQIPT